MWCFKKWMGNPNDVMLLWTYYSHRGKFHLFNQTSFISLRSFITLKVGFITCTAARHQGVIETFQFHFGQFVMLPWGPGWWLIHGWVCSVHSQFYVWLHMNETNQNFAHMVNYIAQYLIHVAGFGTGEERHWKRVHGKTESLYPEWISESCTYFRKTDEVCTLLVLCVCVCARLRIFECSCVKHSEWKRVLQREQKKKETEPASEKINGARGESEGESKKKETVKVKQIQRDQCADFSWHIQGSTRLKALQLHSSKGRRVH